jgi:hypothetical protein
MTLWSTGRSFSKTMFLLSSPTPGLSRIPRNRAPQQLHHKQPGHNHHPQIHGRNSYLQPNGNLIRAYTFKPRTIQKGWRDTGLIPPNAARIDENIRRDVAEFDAENNNSDSEADSEADDESDGTPQMLKTPLTIRTLKRNINHCLKNEELSDNIKRTLFGAYTMSVAGDQAVGELRSMTSIAQSRRSRQQRSRTISKSSMGAIYSHTARKMVQIGFNLIKELQLEYTRMKGMPVTKKKWHLQAYQPVHDQLQLVWASMRSAGTLLYEINIITGVVETSIMIKPRWSIKFIVERECGRVHFG